MSVTKAIARAKGKMLADSSCIFWKLCKRRRRGAIAFWGGVVLGCFLCLKVIDFFTSINLQSILSDFKPNWQQIVAQELVKLIEPSNSSA
jgi:hypothetical protein